MKSKYIHFLLLFPALFIFSCHNNKLVKPNDTTAKTTNVYVSGTSNYKGSLAATYWKNGVANILDKATSSAGTGIAVSGNDIYISGYRRTATGGTVAAYWKNGAEHDLADSTLYSYAGSIATNGANVYIAGISTTSSGALSATVWENGIASAITSNIMIQSLGGITVNGDNVYVTGILNPGGSPPPLRGVYWKNGIQQSVNTSAFRLSTIQTLALNDTDVYAVGVGTNSMLTLTSPVYWKNGTPTILTPADNYPEGQALGIAFHGSDIYIAGLSINGSNREATMWKNGVPVALTVASTGATAFAITIFGVDVYIAGQDAAGNPAYWKNGVLIELPQQTGNANTATGVVVVSQ